MPYIAIRFWHYVRPMPLDPHSGYQVYEAEAITWLTTFWLATCGAGNLPCCQASARWLVREHKVPAEDDLRNSVDLVVMYFMAICRVEFTKNSADAFPKCGHFWGISWN